MALKIKPVVLVKRETVAAPAPSATVTSLSPKGARETGDTKSISVRLPPSHYDMLEEIKVIAECDKSEAVKRALRLFYNGLRGRDAVLTVTGHDGKTITIPVMTNGRPA